MTMASGGQQTGSSSEPARANDTQAVLTQGSISRHLVAQTLPMIVGIVCIIGVGLVDAYFIGQLGADPLAAISFLFPVTTALSSLGVGIMVGVNSVISRALGAGERDRAECRTAQGIVFAGGFGLLIALLLFSFSSPLFDLLNASPALEPLIRAYVLPFASAFLSCFRPWGRTARCAVKAKRCAPRRS